MKMKGARVLLECLKELGVDTVFGYPGGQVIPIYDALYDERKLKHYITAHEQGASHAADGYARATGGVGVVIATSGPGATNTVTGIATAYRDSVPMLIITGQVPRSLIGHDSFQEVDIIDITASITKKSYLVKEVEELPYILKEAYELTRSGRPGPVLVDIPKDIQTSFLDFNGYQQLDEIKSTYDEVICNSEVAMDSKGVALELDKAIEAINQAKRPVIYCGGEVGS